MCVAGTSSAAFPAAEQSVWHDVEWRVAGYAGHWWAMAKSIESHKLSTGYVYYTQCYLPPGATGGGWTNS